MIDVAEWKPESKTSAIINHEARPYVPVSDNMKTAGKENNLVSNPADLYDGRLQTNTQEKKYEVKEVESGVFVYEVKDKKNVGFGKNIESIDKVADYQIDFVVNWPLVKDEITKVITVDENGQQHEEEYMLPRWWYIDNGQQQQNFIDPAPIWKNFGDNNWIFGLDKNWNLYVVPYADLNKKQIDWQWAFQNWPILLLDGQNPHSPNTKSKLNRSGIWYKKDGTLIVIYAEKPVNFWEFAELFRKQDCTNAIFLDGETSYAGYADKGVSHWYLKDNAIKLQFYLQKK